MKLEKSLAAWGGSAFAATLKAELETLPPGEIPLQKAANWAVDHAAPILVSVLGVQASEAAITARLGIFFTETIAGCACGDAPMRQSAYADFEVTMDRATAEAHFLELD